MNCGEWEERLALYAGGDLAAEEARAVERHVAECSGCQLLLSGLRQSLQILRDEHAEPIEAAHFAAVRARVLARIERRPASRWWIYAMAAAAAVVLLASLWPRPETRLALPLPQAPAAPAVAKVELPPQRVIRKRAEPSETVMVKVETNNPDVVIYWIAETKGETK